ncbi:hypothetical protein BKA70DRAFT_1250085 [Coprinopsis sp. MPI-PUGE-AT-0042]|nr:hypothetical protein BKA70DRAFT_1250085 [Coprinopsis sp. MPI-PUGE-AT-0042]
MDSDDEFDSMSIASDVPSSRHDSESIASRSMRSASPSGSVWSVSSSLHAAAYREEHGRHLNNYSDVYRLPADQEELDRLDKQHLMFIEVMGGKYPPPMAEVMEQSYPDEPKYCGDLGCGSGCWIMDVAIDFPHSDCVGVDLVPMHSPRMPPNCRSEIDDVNLGLAHFSNHFDVVHARLVSSGIKDYENLIDEMSMSLKEGGLIYVTEFDFHVYDHEFKRYSLNPGKLEAPWWPRFLSMLREAARASGGDVDAAAHLYDWVNAHPNFEEVTYREFWISCSPWAKGDPWQMRLGEWMREDILAFIRSGRPLLLSQGHPADLVDYLAARATQELMQARVPGYIRLQGTYARKRSRKSKREG